MSNALIGSCSRSSISINQGSGQQKRPNEKLYFGEARDFVKNSIPHASLPVAKIYRASDTYGRLADSTECHLWSADWNCQITAEGEAFLEEAACLGYTEDQSLAVMYVSKFDVKAARERLQKFRNIYIPILSGADQQIFTDLMNSSLGKKFSSYRYTKLAHVPVKELVNYYYYQKLMAKRKNYSSSTLNRTAMEIVRERLTPEYLKDIRFSIYVKNSEVLYNCNVCFKRSKDVYKAGTEHLFCAMCYSHYQKYRRLPNLVAVEPITLPYSTPEGLAERAGARGQENCIILANSHYISLLREHRRQAQRLTRIRRAGPSSADRVFLMNQIDAVLSQENYGRVSTTTCLEDIITIE